MSSDDFKAQLLSVQLVEIQYKPYPKLLDHRGTLAQSVSHHMGLSEWRIDTNRVDVFHIDQREKCFVAFRNAGYVIGDAPTKEIFPDRASKFFRFVFSQSPFENSLAVERIGVRCRFAMPFPGAFDDLLQRYTSRFMSLSTEAASDLNGTVIDVGLTLNLRTTGGYLNINSGPMERKQLRQFLEVEDDSTLPEVALFVDLDYWSRPNDQMPAKAISNVVKQRAEDNWTRFERMQKLVMDV